ncbi:hypothetical protein [Leptolyngbya sp. GB1-A1]|uniref:hypothetical protein n=1 Tax=Leptolyngbya sp. GB1-A1 TaxID=2933908 RepID=UPI003297F3E9
MDEIFFTFIREIREEKGLNPYKMAKLMNFKTVERYLEFERSKKALNVEKLLLLWRISGWSAKRFMERMEDDFRKEQVQETK